MLLPLIAIAVTGLATFRESVGGLERFREETVAEATLIERSRNLLSRADDLGEAYVEQDDPVAGVQFASQARRIDDSFDNLETLSTPRERALASTARGIWDQAAADLNRAAAQRTGSFADLDPFHDHIDSAVSELANLLSLNGGQVGAEISALRGREQVQLLAVLATLLVGLLVAGAFAHRLRRSITSPLPSLEEAAAHFGSDELSHRITVRGDDELARVGRAFNEMAGKLRKGQEELRYRAVHDSLTGLPNRALFMERMGHAIERADRLGSAFSMLYVDLDGFKAVNDTLGHEAGDELLVAVAQRLRDSLRGKDLAARLGGDEFGILLEDTTADDARGAAERLTRAFDGPVSISAGEVPVGLSIGVATRQADEELDELIRQADEAMYVAKARGTGQWQVFGLDVDRERRETWALRTDLEHAIQRHEFVVHYQPIVDLQSGAVEAVEALVRWNHPERGLLAPADFLTVAEESGQILFIERYVMHEACRQVRAWQIDLAGAGNLFASVNVSARQLQLPGFADEVAGALLSSGLSAEHLILEVTETALLHDIDDAAAELWKVKTLGVQIALDDFGTGYSSLSHLLRFPVDIVKIDRSFIAAIHLDDVRADLALTLVTLSKSLGLKTVAEGIEEDTELDRMRSVRCDLGQGYLFAKPMAVRDLEQLFDRGRLCLPGALTTSGVV